MAKRTKPKIGASARFTQWQIRRLRARLLSYRLLLSDESTYSMLALATDIEETLTPNHADDPETPELKKDRNFKIKQERLRLFLSGGMLETDKLVVIKSFLVGEDMLTEAEFDEADGTKDFLPAFHFLGSANEAAVKRIRKLPGALTSSVKADLTAISLDLQITPDPSGLYFRAVETSTIDHTVGSRFDDKRYAKDGSMKARYFRYGYGFAATVNSRVHIVLRGDEVDEQVTYIECAPIRVPSPTDKAEVYWRYGDTKALPPPPFPELSSLGYDDKTLEFLPAKEKGTKEDKADDFYAKRRARSSASRKAS